MNYESYGKLFESVKRSQELILPQKTNPQKSEVKVNGKFKSFLPHNTDVGNIKINKEKQETSLNL